MIRNLRLAARTLRRSPGFAITATLTLAVGIGLSTAVFTVADALLLRRLPVREQERLITLWGARRDGSFANFPLSLSQSREFARDSRGLAAVASFAYEGATPVSIRDGDNMVRLRRALVSGNWFDVLGAAPTHGRALRPSDDILGAAPAAVISDAAWAHQFGRDPNVVGKRFTLVEFGTSYEIVGVMPPGLEYPRGTDFWTAFVPARLSSASDTAANSPAYTALDLVGRLGPTTTINAAELELSAFFARVGTSEWTRALVGSAQPLERAILGDTRPALLAFTLAAALLLLITCIDVANLLLVRGLARVREIAVRSAIGASRAQVVAQLVTENALLALAGGVVGMGIAWAAVRSFLAFAPVGTPLLGTIGVNVSALAGALGITGVAMVLFGLGPALATARADVQEVLRAGSRPTGSRRSRLLSETLVAAQVGLAVLVLSAAVLLGRSFVALQRADLSFDPERLLIAEVAMRYDMYPTAATQLPVIRRLLDALAQAPGIRAVSPVVAAPFSGSGGWDARLTADGQSAEEVARNPMSNMELVTPSYFETFGIPVVRGRAFNDADREGAEAVIMVSESLARHYWPNQDAIGKRVRLGGGQMLTVVGIVPDTRYRDLRDARATVYFPFAQSFFPFVPTALAIRTVGAPTEAVRMIRRVITESVPGLGLASASPFAAHLTRPLAQPRLNAFLLALFAAAAMLLAAIGLFGVMATMVQQRGRELGVRMALGATAADIVSMVVGRGLAVATLGVAGGIAGALATNRLLASLLYEVRPTDAASLVAVALGLLGVAGAAALLPARVGARIDPAVALRAD